MISSTDQLGRRIELDGFPKKIISLVPSISELIWDLDLKKELVGITKFCIHPEEMFREKTRVGGTKNLNHETIFNLQPDLIIGNKEENTQEDIEKLSGKFRVWMSDVNTHEDALSMILELGKLTARIQQSEHILQKIKANKATVSEKKKVIYLIWNEPYFAVGKDTFINDMLHQAGLENCVTTTRYPEITGEMIRELNPDYLFLSTEPFPFNENHFTEFEPFIPKERIKIVDGEMFSWYGSRMIQASGYFERLRNELNQR